MCCEVSRKWFDAATEEELWCLPTKIMAMRPLSQFIHAHPMDAMRPPSGCYKVETVAALWP